MKKRVAYGKIGRVIEMEERKWGESGGDNEGPALLLTLADRHPDVEWVVVGKNSGWKPPRPNIVNLWEQWASQIKINIKLPKVERMRILDEITMPTFDGLHGAVMWIGQHGSSNSPIPQINDRSMYTSPHDSFVAYVSFITRGINFWRRHDPLANEEVWLIADSRNYLKARDLKWPRRHPILGQYDFTRKEWCERYEDPRTPEECGFTGVTVKDGKWHATDTYIGSGLELVGIPEPKPLSDLPGWEERVHFGILINEARAYGMRPEMTRMDAMKRYVKPLDPAWVHGTWPEKSLEELGMDIRPIPYWDIFGEMARTKATFTTPSSGSHWATAKPWESFGSGTICFFHPLYDTQGHIIPRTETDDNPRWTDEDRYLAQWLRISTPEQLAARVKAVETDRTTYEWLANAQYRLLLRELEAKRCVKMIEARLGL